MDGVRDPTLAALLTAAEKAEAAFQTTLDDLGVQLDDGTYLDVVMVIDGRIWDHVVMASWRIIEGELSPDLQPSRESIAGVLRRGLLHLRDERTIERREEL